MRNVPAENLTASIGEVIFFAPAGARLCPCLLVISPNLSFPGSPEFPRVHLHPVDVDMGDPQDGERDDLVACLEIHETIAGLGLGLAPDTTMTEGVPANGESPDTVPILDPAPGRDLTTPEPPPGVILLITLDPDPDREIGVFGLNFQKMKKNSSAQLPRRFWSMENASKEP